MFIRKKKYPSGNIGVIVAEKVNGMMRELHTVGIATDKDGIEPLVVLGREWIDKENARRHPRLDLFGEERQACEREYLETERVLSNISNVFLNGADLLLDHVFDSVGFNKIEDAVFCQLVKVRLSYPVSKAATVEYLKNHFDEDLNLSKIYRYLDKLSRDCRNLWHVEKAFRISKSKIEIRPMFHFTKRRIEAHVCICFVALKVYKELERILKTEAIDISVDKAA